MKLRVEGDDVVVDQGQQKQCARHVMEDVTTADDALRGCQTIMCKECGKGFASVRADDPETLATIRARQDRLKGR